MNKLNDFGDCPICKAKCKFDEDIVVCPDCGAPYHRKCYNSVNQCMYIEKHSPSFSYSENYNKNKKNNENQEVNDQKSKLKKCPNCFVENSIDAPFCINCGYSFIIDKKSKPPFEKNPFSIQIKNFLNINENETINDIKILDFTKYIKENLLYYIPVFKKIAKENKSKFNFGAFFFSGAWFLYRKLYKFGVVFTTITLLFSILSVFFEFSYTNDILNSLFSSAGIDSNSIITLEKYNILLSQFSSLSATQKFILFLPAIFQTINFFIMILSGFIANRIYFKSCCSKIKKIKLLYKNDQQLYEKELNKFGGVNFKVIPFVFICYIIIEYLPRFLI